MVVPPPFVPQPPRTGSTTRNDTKLNNGTSGAVLPSMHNVRSSQAARHSGSDMTVAAAAFSSASGFRLPVVALPAAAESPPSAASTCSVPGPDDLTRAIPGWYYGVPRDGDSLRRRHERRAASVPFVNVKLMHSVAPRYLHHKIMSTIKTAAGTLQEEAPLYSSFSKDFAFRERDVAALV